MKKYLLVFLCLVAVTAFAEVYKWTDADGRIHYGDNPNKDQHAEEVELKVNSYEHVTVSDYIPASESAKKNNSKHVTIYSTVWCGYCKKAKAYFRENNISFTDYDIEKDADAKKKYNEMGARGVPVILVGNKRMNGFSIAGFNNIYN